jgi:hypothetical protein
VLCCDRYLADLRDRYAFTFQVLDTGTRFTVYTTDGDRFHVAAIYRMLLTDPGTVALPLSVEDLQFLRTCLHNTAHRWRQAITEADAGANRPERPAQTIPPATEPGVIDIEPSPAGYRNAARRFRDELDRVEHLIAQVEQQLHHVTNRATTPE